MAAEPLELEVPRPMTMADPIVMHLVYADDQITHHTTMNISIRLHNKKCEDLKVKCVMFERGTYIKLEDLEDVHLLLLDINMPLKSGDKVLEDFKKEVNEKGFILPPCIAVTTEKEYEEEGIDFVTSEFVTSKGFVFARAKIKNWQDLQSTFGKLKELLGDDWSSNYGKWESPVSIPSARRISDGDAAAGGQPTIDIISVDYDKTSFISPALAARPFPYFRKQQSSESVALDIWSGVVPELTGHQHFTVNQSLCDAIRGVWRKCCSIKVMNG